MIAKRFPLRGAGMILAASLIPICSPRLVEAQATPDSVVTTPAPPCALAPGLLAAPNIYAFNATLAQTFVAVNSGTVTRITHGLNRGAATDFPSQSVQSYNLYLTATKPDGQPTWPDGVLYSARGLRNFALAAQVDAVVAVQDGPFLQAGTAYALVLEPNGPGVMYWFGNPNNIYAQGAAFQFSSSAGWSAPTSGPKDFGFAVEGLGQGPLGICAVAKSSCVLDPGLTSAGNTFARNATLAQTFTPAQTGVPTQVTHGLRQEFDSAPTYNLYLTTTDGSGAPSWPGGILYSAKNLSIFASGSGVDGKVPISAGPTLLAGTKYALVLEPVGPGVMYWRGNSGASSYPPGAAYELGSANLWTLSTIGPKDLGFSITGTGLAPDGSCATAPSVTCVLDPGLTNAGITFARHATLAQTFTPVQSGLLTQVTHALRQESDSAPTYNLYITTSVGGVPSWPSGILYSAKNLSTFASGSGIDGKVPVFAGPVLAAGTKYALVLEPVGAGLMYWRGNSGKDVYSGGDGFELGAGNQWNTTTGPADHGFIMEGICTLAPRTDLEIQTTLGNAPGSYVINVNNVGTGPTTGAISVSDVLPPELSFVSGTGAGWVCAPYFGPVVKCFYQGALPLAPGASLPPLTIKTKLAPNTSASKVLTNCAVVGTPGDTNSTNDTSCVQTSQAIGAEPPNRLPPLVWELSNTNSTLSRSEGNLSEPVDLSRVVSTNGPTISFSAVYNSYNADGSRAQVDTVMGFGWTHSYNIFLFSQLGAMFRYGGDGRVTRYKLGPDGAFIAAPGYFETLVRNSDGSFTITQKDQTKFTFAAIPDTPFLVSGPVWRLTSVVDRNGNKITLTYAAGNLTSITDTYGRSMTLTYNSQRKLASIMDPAGRNTTLQYDPTFHQLIKITDPTGNSIQYSYNLLNQLTGKTDKDGRTFSYAYVNNEPVAVNDSAGGARATLSNPNNWATDSNALVTNQLRVYLPSITSNTDGRGNVWQYGYDANGYVTSAVAPDGATTTYSYDPATLMLAARTDANGHTTRYQYDNQGNLLRMTNDLGQATTYSYEPVFNMRTSMTDTRGRLTLYSHDSRGNLIQETDPAGQARKWTYDSHGNILSETNRNGNTMAHQYDAFGDRTKMTDPLGNVTLMTFDAVGNAQSRTDAKQHKTSLEYDGMNRVIRETDPAGKATQFVYNGEGQPVQTIDRNSHATAYQYDVQNRPNKTTDALGNVATAAYDPVGNLLSQTDANSHTTTHSYDRLNRLIVTTDAVGNVTQLGYDTGTLLGSPCGPRVSSRNSPATSLPVHPNMPFPSCGATLGSNVVTKQTDANGKVTYFKYDLLDRQISVVRKVGSTSDTVTSNDAVTSYTYDPVGNRQTMTEPNGNTMTYQYDADNRPTKMTNAAGDVTVTTYDGVSNVIGTTGPNLDVTTKAYDALNRVTEVNDSIGLVGRYTYDAVGNRLSRTDGNGNTTTYVYDALNRPVTITDPLGKTTISQYDAVGNVVKVTDRNGNVTTHVYDTINRRISTTNALGNITQSQYDAVGNLIKMTDANNHATQYAYDSINRPIQETYADGRSRSTTYDGVGNLLTRTDQIGQTTTYSYNDLYFLLGRSYPSAVNDVFTYDLSRRMLTAQRGGWPVTFAYDGANRLTRTVQNGHTVAYSYNIPGRTRTVTYPGGRVITEHTDARTRLDRIDDAASPPIVRYSFDLGNRVTNRSYRNGTVTAYSYNSNDWMVSIEHASGATRIAGFGYDYDGEGNKKFEQKRHDTGHSEAYQYDNIYRLTNYTAGELTGAPITQTAYNLDPVGNWNSKTTDAVTQTRQHDAVNELVKIDGANLSYDANGNLQSDASYTYAYDEEDRLTRVTRKSDSAVVGQYLYDALGRRVAKTGTLYLYDRDRIIEEQRTIEGNTQATYVYGNYIDEVLTMERGGQTFYYHQNALWSAEALTGSTGSVVERYSYDAYGLPSVSDGTGVPLPLNSSGTAHSAVGNPWMFTGRQLDEETGLYFYRARHYDPAKGRFISRDSTGIWGDSANLGNGYGYVGNNPTNASDPLGMIQSFINSAGQTCYCKEDIRAAGYTHVDVAGTAYVDSETICSSDPITFSLTVYNPPVSNGSGGTGWFFGGTSVPSHGVAEGSIFGLAPSASTPVSMVSGFSFNPLTFGGGSSGGAGAGGTWFAGSGNGLSSMLVNSPSGPGVPPPGDPTDCYFHPWHPGCNIMQQPGPLLTGFGFVGVPPGPYPDPLNCLLHPESPGCWDLPNPDPGPVSALDQISGVKTYPAVRDGTLVVGPVIKPIQLPSSLAVRDLGTVTGPTNADKPMGYRAIGGQVVILGYFLPYWSYWGAHWHLIE